jgi:hypothetical protein
MIRFACRLWRGAQQWLGSLTSRFDPSPRLTVVRIHEMPARPSQRYLYIVGDRGEDWYAGMVCPCGCGALIELNLVPPGRPCWRVNERLDGRLSMSPSVWRQEGCRSHFWIRGGRIVWVRESRGNQKRRHRRSPGAKRLID